MTNPFELLENRLIQLEETNSKILDLLSKHLCNTDEKLHTVKDLASLSGVSELTVRNWIDKGLVKAKRIGRRLFIENDEFHKALNDVKSIKYKR